MSLNQKLKFTPFLLKLERNLMIKLTEKIKGKSAKLGMMLYAHAHASIASEWNIPFSPTFNMECTNSQFKLNAFAQIGKKFNQKINWENPKGKSVKLAPKKSPSRYI